MGMVVRTNTMALNAYRQLGMNNNAVSKSLEKLSSGFRINRAADDAAGLAISEKMKAQIKGLETASANAQDGISLLQTAEGNLSEVHNMLNRMVELATKSANGTYTITEREALQDEVDQLLSEIDRISQSANFNGAKLLDGSLDGEGKTIVKDATFKGEKAPTDDEIGSSMGLDEDPKVHKEAAGAAKTSFTVDLNYATYKFSPDADKGGTTISNLVFAFREGADNKLMDSAGKAITYDVTLNDEGGIDATGLAKSIYDGIEANANGKKYVYVGIDTSKASADGASAVTGGKLNADVIEYEVTLDGDKLTFTMTDKGANTAKAYDKANEADIEGKTKDSAFSGNFNYWAVNNKDATDTDLTAGSDAAAFADAVGQSQGVATSVIQQGSVDAGMQRAEAILKIDPTTIKDGAGIRVGDQYYVWAGKDETFNGKYGDNVTVVDIRDLVGDDGSLGVATTNDADNTLKEALARFTVAAKDNKMFIVQSGIHLDTMSFTERIPNENSDKLTTVAGVTEQFGYFTGISANVEKVGGNGSALTLQIGDTADSYNKMSVNIADMSAKGLGINGLDITSEASASKAIDTIKSAINTVSSTRAGMGALQNRLDYTINNLDVAVENLSAANSRIRDTDMAKEMMNYTKMNVLVQSAQAMLAQANQQPQSVLQLLQ